VKRKWLRRLLWGVGGAGLLALVLGVYDYSFEHACAQTYPGDNPKPSLVVLGIPFPYTPTTAKIFWTVYRPLIERAAAAHPRQQVSGPISYPENDRQRILIGTGPDQGIGLLVPPQLWWKVNALAQGEKVDAVYGYTPVPESPFCDSFQLVSIAPKTEN
jgi:hypothetical protein